MIKKTLYPFLTLFYLSALSVQANAAVVRMEVFFGNIPAGDVFIEMFDADAPAGAPATVANFLNYIDDGNGNRRYDGTFIHRHAVNPDGSEFVIQGGGYKFDPSLGFTPPGDPPHIPTDPPVTNEFDASRSNLCGTIAMAKLGNDINSATSEWFINLADNTFLDNAPNNLFTVFGEIIGKDSFCTANSPSSVINDILSKPIENQNDNQNTFDAFSTLPVVADTTGGSITESDLITVTMTNSPYPKPLFLDPAPVDFGLTAPNQIPLSQQLVTILNTGTNSLSFSSIGITDPLAAPFAVVQGSDNCSNQTLTSFSSCTLAISFDPQVFGTLLQDSLDIPFNDGAQKSITLNVAGTGAFTAPTLETSPAAVIDFGSVALADFNEQDVVIRNVGVGDLQPGTISFSGTNASDFTIASESPANCSSAPLALSETCTLTIRYTANILGSSQTATLNINASPGSQTAQITLNGNAIVSQADLVGPANTTVDFGDIRSDLSSTRDVTFQNQGTEDLIFTGFNISGTDASQFTVAGTSCQRISQSGSCDETITFTPSGLGARSATLDVLTNDPDTPVLTLTLTATSSTDNDGIPDSEEAAAPNNGDGNLDNIPDVQQENVTSLPDINGNYITLEAPPGISITGVSAIDNPAPGITPTIDNGSITFPQGFTFFTLKNVAPGGSVAVTYHLTPGTNVNSYFKFGVPAPFTAAQWFQFLFDGETGAEFSSDKVTLHFVDGGRGDSDLDATNGEILDPGGPALITADSGSSSGGCMFRGNNITKTQIRMDWLILLLFVGLLRHHHKRYNLLRR